MKTKVFNYILLLIFYTPLIIGMINSGQSDYLIGLTFLLAWIHSGVILNEKRIDKLKEQMKDKNEK